MLYFDIIWYKFQNSFDIIWYQFQNSVRNLFVFVYVSCLLHRGSNIKDPENLNYENMDYIEAESFLYTTFYLSYFTALLIITLLFPLSCADLATETLIVARFSGFWRMRFVCITAIKTPTLVYVDYVNNM
jgi:hypothetical protein